MLIFLAIKVANFYQQVLKALGCYTRAFIVYQKILSSYSRKDAQQMSFGKLCFTTLIHIRNTFLFLYFNFLNLGDISFLLALLYIFHVLLRS